MNERELIKLKNVCVKNKKSRLTPLFPIVSWTNGKTTFKAQYGCSVLTHSVPSFKCKHNSNIKMHFGPKTNNPPKWRTQKNLFKTSTKCWSTIQHSPSVWKVEKSATNTHQPIINCLMVLICRIVKKKERERKTSPK